ncbi:hypothetical protein AX14_005822 [Amanita brunnescens Koide BX004]|nr:hypothetical protein AX14_005822 [Amanita brunnescens Koide BX004]
MKTFFFAVSVLAFALVGETVASTPPSSAPVASFCCPDYEGAELVAQFVDKDGQFNCQYRLPPPPSNLIYCLYTADGELRQSPAPKCLENAVWNDGWYENRACPKAVPG